MPQARARRSRTARFEGQVRTGVRTGHDFRVRDLDGLAIDDAREHRRELGPKLAYVVAVLNDSSLLR
jgi:hypothetical protein